MAGGYVGIYWEKVGGVRSYSTCVLSNRTESNTERRRETETHRQTRRQTERYRAYTGLIVFCRRTVLLHNTECNTQYWYNWIRQSRHVRAHAATPDPIAHARKSRRTCVTGTPDFIGVITPLTPTTNSLGGDGPQTLIYNTRTKNDIHLPNVNKS